MTAESALYLRSFGTGNRPALAIHCTLATGASWRAVASHLSDRLTLSAFDLPSHGQSGNWDGREDIHALCVRWAASVMPPEPIDLLGHSFGATVALRVAVEQPQRVRSLTLIEPVFFAAAALDAPEAFAQYGTLSRPFEDALRAQDTARAAQLFNRLWGDGTKWNAFSDRAQRYMVARMHLVPAQSPVLFEDTPGLLAPGRMARANMPTLLLKGDQSPEVIGHINTALYNRLPDVRCITIQGAGHMAPITHAKEVAEAIRALLDVT